MPKLHLKRTPEEEAVRRLRKKEKKEKKASKRRRHDDLETDLRDSKRHRSSTSHNGRKWASDDEEDFIGPQPASSSSSSKHAQPDSFPSGAYKPDYEAIQAELEEQRFREKLSSAFDDDEGFDALEARLNSFAHVPKHWSGSGGQSGRAKPNYESDDFLKLDPMSLDEEDYVEWIRRGMYRKTHAQEYEEHKRAESERAQKRSREKAIKAETERLEREATDERKRKKQEKENRKRRQALQVYHDRWQTLLSVQSDPVEKVGFDDIPWPVFPTHQTRSDRCISLEDLSKDAISSFLFTSLSGPSPSTPDVDPEKGKKDRKDKLREAFLRFHPDKFEGRFMHRVQEAEKEKVRTGLASVVRALNDLMSS
ncbi:hypothetical protein V5O48_011011 [Marasmius crinis-equi]|uniref:Uncharacterized protein n=1 Tax=Marasmius crinis-equi TaxID=585013 RepID=A0ABR3F6V0_9AGAR